MLYTAARVPTEHAGRHAARLLSRMVDPAPAELVEGRATITLPGGSVLLAVSDRHLDLIARAAGEEDLAAVEDAVGRQLVHAAAGDELTVRWAPMVRPATVADDAALLALDTVSWTPGSGFPSVSHGASTSFFGGRRTPETHLVAALGDQVVGCVSTLPKTPFAEGAHVYGLWGLMVAPEARRLGVASALLAAAERTVVERGGRKMSLRVLGTNEAAQGLYERHGYVVEGRYEEEFLIDGRYVHDLSLAKKLG
ncbi:MAG: GNAT family N-acetyltransferase [Actinocatenispora sp.]